ncbi:hypothetical protein KAU88_06560 [Candidatus Bathyarchaeota archaeon]|nr:hypothetical protein [Candidatus Bathyarchaeota archaeon]
MGSEVRVGKGMATYSLSLGLIYSLFGLFELVLGLDQSLGLGWFQLDISTALICPDLFGGCMLIIIGIIFLFGIDSQWKGNREGISFLVVGTILAMVFFAVYATIMASHALGYGIYQVTPEPHADPLGDWAEWIWLDDIRPAIWLFTLVLPGLYMTLQTWKRKG